MGKCSDFVDRMWGCQTETVWVPVVLNAAAPVEVLPPNPNRFSWTIINVGAAIGYIGWDEAVAAARSVNLLAAGMGQTGVNARDDGNLPTYRVYGLGAGATTLFVVETRGL